MSRKSVQRLCDNDMRKMKDLKRGKRIWKIATRGSVLRSRSKPPKEIFGGFFASGTLW